MKLIEKIFSVKNRKNHKIVHLLFFRMKFRQQVSNQELLNKINAILCNEEKIIGKLVETSKPKKGKAFLPFLSLHLVDKCNNNCESCSHFCTLADNFILNPADYEKDLTILAHKFNVGEIDLMGGEPLLHPQIVKIFDITRRIIYSSPEEILNYLKTPLSCCRYCRNVNKLKRRPWKRSQRKIDEWEDAEA